MVTRLTGATKSKQSVVSEFRRGAILEAARKVFARQGFTDALMDDIAEEAGIAKGTVYLYFRSKEDIYAAAMVRDIQSLHALVRSSMEQAQGVQAKLRAFIDERLKYFETNQEFFRIYYSEVGSQLTRCKPIPVELRGPYLEQLRVLESVLEEGMRRRQIRRMPVEQAAFVVYDLTRALIERRLQGWSKTSPAKDLEFLMDFLWRSLAAETPPLRKK